MNILETLADSELFGGMFDAPSWRPWKVFLAALHGLPMDQDDLEVFRHHTGRQTAPTKPARAATLICGRRAGKSRTLSLIAAYLACIPDHAAHVVAGETPVIACIAADRRQARIILSYIIGTLRAVPVLAELIETVLTESVQLTNGVMIEVHTASIGAPRGRTFLAVLCDETAFWPTADAANPDFEVINAVRPGLTTIPYSLLLVASSPYAKRGVLYSDYAKYFGKDNASILVWQGSTAEMNATLVDDPLIAEMYRDDPDRADAEFGAKFRSDIVAFITREAVEATVAAGVYELPPGGGIAYAGFVDPSGGSADSFSLAIAHLSNDGLAILDAVREVRPPFSPDQVVQEFARLLKSYGINRVSGDAYAGEWPRERFAAHGISYDVAPKSKNVIYGEFLPALNGRRVQLLDLPRLTAQLTGLERRVARGGRDSIDHSPGSHDDLANAAAGVLVLVIADRRPGLVQPDSLLVANVAPPLPTRCDQLFATLAIGVDGTSAVIFAAVVGDTLFVLDFDMGSIRADLFPVIASRLGSFLVTCGAKFGRALLFVPPGMARQAHAAGISAHDIPEQLADPEQLLLPAASHIAAGRVKVCQPAHTRAETNPFGGALALKAGDGGSDPLRAAVIWSIALGLDPG